MEEKIFMILQEIQSKIDFIENETRNIKTQLNIHSKILKEIQYAEVVSSAKQEAMEYDIAHIRSDLEDLKDDLYLREQTPEEWNNRVRLII